MGTWHSDFLFSPMGIPYLQKEYVEKDRSTYDIARERGVYANLIRRALVFHGFKLKDKSQAQSIACKKGRHKRGKNRAKKED